MKPNNKLKNKKYMLLLAMSNAIIGIIVIAIGIFNLLDPESIIRSVIFVFGETAGRIFLVLMGILIISMSIQLIKVYRSEA